MHHTSKAQPNQTLIDIAMQEAGSVEALFDFALLNNLSVTEDLQTGKEYIRPGVIDKNIVVVFSAINKPASGSTYNGYSKPGGIDYMQIGNDFKVS